VCNYDTNMAIIGIISGIPLFSTRQEALAWASSNGLTGYHTHVYQNQKGYMGGVNHNQASAPRTIVATPTANSTPTTSSTPSTNSSGGGGY